MFIQKSKYLIIGFLAAFVNLNAQSINIAKNKPVKAFPEIEDNDPKYLLDEDDNTIFYAHKYTPVNRIHVDFQNEYEIDRILFRGFRGLDSGRTDLKNTKQKEHFRIWAFNKGKDSLELFSGILPAKKLITFKPVYATELVVEYATSESRPMGELEVYEVEKMPIMINQSGYNTQGYKRFTAPKAIDGSEFQILNDKNEEVLFKGTVQNQIGDFSPFKPSQSGPYVVRVKSMDLEGRSFPFQIEPYLLERVSYTPAVQFMIDDRCWYGSSTGYAPTDKNAGCPILGIAWRDSHQFSFELQALINMYFANPDAFSKERMPLKGIYEGLRHNLADDSPEIVKLIHWAVDIYLRGKVNHTLMKEQLAYFLYAYPELEEYIPRALYDEAKDYLFAIWGNDAINRWQWHDIEHSGNLFQTYSIVGTGKGQFPPGHSIVPNLMMYEVAKRENRKDADLYFNAAFKQTEWLIKNLDWNDPKTTKGQRMTEWVTIDALAYFYNNYPKNKQPANLYKKIERWAQVAVQRSENMWDFRKYSNDKFVIPDIREKNHPQYNPDGSFNEPGNVAGFGAAALQATNILKGPIGERLKQMAAAQIDNVFGRNPAGRHFSYKAVRDFEGADLGWFQNYEDGAGQLHTVRGVLDGSPKEEIYPYNPYGGDPGHTEGWVTFQTAWMQGIAQSSKAQVEILLKDDNNEVINKISPNRPFKLELAVPLNLDIHKQEEASVGIYRNGTLFQTLTLKEDGENSLTFSKNIVLDQLGDVKWKKGDMLEISYGLAHMKVSSKYRL